MVYFPFYLLIQAVITTDSLWHDTNNSTKLWLYRVWLGSSMNLLEMSIWVGNKTEERLSIEENKAVTRLEIEVLRH